MDDFTLEIYPIRDLMPGACRICDMVGARAPVTHCVEVNGLDATYSCANHIRHAINDSLDAVEHPWRVYVEPSERVHSDIVHRTARELMRVAAKLRRNEIGINHAADMIRHHSTRVHEAALFLSHYENMEGNNDE